MVKARCGVTEKRKEGGRVAKLLDDVGLSDSTVTDMGNERESGRHRKF